MTLTLIDYDNYDLDFSVYDDYDLDLDFDDDEVDGGGETWTSDERDEHTEALSCIGVRRLCIRDASCRRLLHRFRQYCVEDTTIHQCVTTQWFVTALYEHEFGLLWQWYICILQRRSSSH